MSLAASGFVVRGRYLLMAQGSWHRDHGTVILAAGVPGRQVGHANSGLIGNDGADVVCPVRFTAAAGRLRGLDRAAAALADFPCGMSGVIFLRRPVAFAEVGMRKSLALPRDIAVLWCISGGHLHSLGQTPSRNATLLHPAWHGLCDGQTSSLGQPCRPDRGRVTE